MTTQQPPAWLTKGNRGKAAIREDAVCDKTKRIARAPVFDDKVYSDAMTVEQAMEVGNQAIETVQWNLKSKPFGVQAFALQRCRSPIKKQNIGQPRFGFGFFMEQGLGKTKTVLADFWNLYNAGINDCLVVITVNSMKDTWRREMEDENYPFDIHVWPEFNKLPTAVNGQVIIMNYEALFRRGGDMLFTWMRRGRPYISFDESTSLMNQSSKQSKAGVKLAAVAVSQRCLAGKPNPMGPHNFWPQLRVIRAPVGDNYYPFRNTFCVMGGYQGRNVTGQKNVPQLVEIMKNRAFFADKKTWAPGLPDKKYSELVCTMSDAQKKAYKTMANDLYAELDGGKLIEIEHTLHKSMKLQQISGGFLYDENHVPHRIGKGTSAKIEMVKEFLANATGKTIVFAHFEPTVRLLMEMYPNAPYALAKDKMSPGVLEENKRRFNSDEDMEPFIASSSVLKFGHTLVGTPTNPCQNVLFAENTYSLLTRDQAEARAHRWGASTDLITYYDLICSPVDRDMVRALKNRDNLAMALLNALKGYVNE